MHISLKNICPAPLTEMLNTQSQLTSEIWQSDVDFIKGKHYQINASSGKGKSTFIHIIYGLRTDYTGEACINQQSVLNISRKEWAMLRQQKIADIFQDLRLFSELTAWDNLQVKAVLQNENMDHSIREMTAHLGVDHILNKKADLLSYGERQRIAIIRALCQPFEFILMDEPFSHLDKHNIEKACELIDHKCRLYQAGMIMTSLGYQYELQFDEQLRL